MRQSTTSQLPAHQNSLMAARAIPLSGGVGWGGLKAWNDDDVETMMKLLAFYILFTKGIFRELEKSTQRFFFAFALLCDFCFCSCSFVRTLHLTHCIFFFGDEAS
jgi:hypothetical protein